MNILCFETTNAKNESIVKLLFGFTFKNNFTFTEMEHLGWEEIKCYRLSSLFILTVSTGFLYLALSGIYSKVNETACCSFIKMLRHCFLHFKKVYETFKREKR